MWCTTFWSPLGSGPYWALVLTGLWSKVVQYVGNAEPFGTQPLVYLIVFRMSYNPLRTSLNTPQKSPVEPQREQGFVPAQSGVLMLGWNKYLYTLRQAVSCFP
jgi:hypothetical protein